MDLSKMKSLKVLPSLFFSLFFIFVASASAENKKPVPASEGIYQTEAEKGYYNYEVIAEEPEEEEQEEQHMANQAQPPQKYSYDELWNMHPDAFQALIDEVTKWAVGTPTEENVTEYLKVQDVARRKSAAFASVVGYVGQMNPQYSVAGVSPITAPGRRAVTEYRLDEIDSTILRARNEFALIMFSQQGCSFCTSQRSILGYFENNYQWPVRVIDIYQNPGLAAEYGVERTPAIALVHGQTGQALPIASGVTSMSDLRTRIYRSIRMLKGEIRPEQWATYQYEMNSGKDPLQFVSNPK